MEDALQWKAAVNYVELPAVLMSNVCVGYEGTNGDGQENGYKAWHNHLKAGSLKFLPLKWELIANCHFFL
jgi:hypothetical protein